MKDLLFQSTKHLSCDCCASLERWKVFLDIILSLYVLVRIGQWLESARDDTLGLVVQYLPM